MFCLLMEFVSAAWPGITTTYGLLIITSVQNFFWIYLFKVMSDGLKLRKESFSKMDVNDVIKCVQRAIAALEENPLGSTNVASKEVLKTLKLIYNVDLWKKVENQQLKELGGITARLIPNQKIDLTGTEEASLLKAAECLKEYSGVEVSYYEKLKNLKIVSQTIKKKEYEAKLLIASFIMQITFSNSINKMHNSDSKKDIQSGNVDIVKENPPVSNTGGSSSVMKLPDNVPSNILYNSESYLDKDFLNSGCSDICIWTRAKDVPPTNKEMTLFSENYEGTIKQGDLDDCWLIATLNVLGSQASHYIKEMFTAKEIQENGKYTLKIYSQGTEKLIDLDDYFPCYTFTTNPCCCQVLVDSATNKKFIWPLLVEKAIAKEYGGYNNLNGGGIDYALMQITGNPAFRYNLLNEEIRLQIADNSFWVKLLEFVNKGFLLGGGTLPTEEIPSKYESISGRHAYAILDAFEFDGVKLLQLSDPRGVSKWVGDWSANSEKWTSRLKEMCMQRFKIQKERKSKANIKEKPLLSASASKTTFFISWEEFIRCFEVIFVSISFDNLWRSIQISDQWAKIPERESPVTLDANFKTPQYLLTIPTDMEIFCLLVHLVPASVRKMYRIGFEIYEHQNKSKKSDINTPKLVAIGRYSAERVISLNCILKKGQYLVLIATYDQGEYKSFTFTIWHSKDLEVKFEQYFSNT